MLYNQGAMGVGEEKGYCTNYTNFFGVQNKYNDNNIKQDAREAMRVVFSVLTKRICMHKN